MIKSFADEVTEAIFHGHYTHAVRKAFSTESVKAAERKLDLLNCTKDLMSLKSIPSIKAEAARDAHGKYSIPVDSKWRLVFGWNGNPENVEIIAA